MQIRDSQLTKQALCTGCFCISSAKLSVWNVGHMRESINSCGSNELKLVYSTDDNLIIHIF